MVNTTFNPSFTVTTPAVAAGVELNVPLAPDVTVTAWVTIRVVNVQILAAANVLPSGERSFHVAGRVARYWVPNASGDVGVKIHSAPDAALVTVQATVLLLDRFIRVNPV